MRQISRISLCLALAVAFLTTHGRAADLAGPGTVKQDCSICPEIVLILAGTFAMGVPEQESVAATAVLEYDRPARPITQIAIGQSVWFGRYPVTRGEYQAFADETRASQAWRNPGFTQTDRHPVVNVSYLDAAAYLGWLSVKTGLRYRMPSEAEWEYAARAMTQTARFWGDGLAGAAHYMPLDAHSTTQVGNDRLPNGFGLYDMLGHVWQWTADCWHPNYLNRPPDGSVWQGGNCERHTLRGGSWNEGPGSVRAGVRYRVDAAGRSPDVGFRVVRDAD